MIQTPQVDQKHYAFGTYGFEGRFVSYYWQLREVLALAPGSVLEVGVGDGVFGGFLKKNTDVAYTSLDIAEDLQPDLIGSVTAIPLPTGVVDVACAFEVLEHIPFTEFEKAIEELMRVARRAVVISIPHFGPMLALSFKLPFIPRQQWAVKLPFPKKHVFNGQHYWEVGKQGYSAARIRTILARFGTVTRDFVPFNSEYHHFYVIEKRD